MTDALVEKVARALCSRRIAEVGIGDAMPDGRDVDLRWEIFVPEARAAILAVLDHFSEPSNVTEEMRNAATLAYMNEKNTTWCPVIAQAMSAARDEVSRDK